MSKRVNNVKGLAYRPPAYCYRANMPGYGKDGTKMFRKYRRFRRLPGVDYANLKVHSCYGRRSER